MFRATISVSDSSQTEPIFDSNGLFGSLMLLSPWSADARRRSDLSSATHQYMQPLQIVGQTYQIPLTSRRQQASQRELTESQRFFDDANDRFYGRFAQAVDSLADDRPEFVSHLDDQSRIFRRRLRLLGKAFLPALMVAIMPCGDIGLDARYCQMLWIEPCQAAISWVSFSVP